MYLHTSLKENVKTIKQQFGVSMDLLVREISVCDINVGLFMCEGMINIQTLSEILLEPLCSLTLQDPTPEKLLDWVENRWALAADQTVVYDFEKMTKFMMSGFTVMVIDGIPCAIAMGMQGFSFRSISDPNTEVNVRGSHEGLVEALRISMTMVRRRIKSPTLKFEAGVVGNRSNTDYCLVYLSDKVSQKILNEVKTRLNQIDIDTVLDSSYLSAFLEEGHTSVFSGIGITERPDVLCAKINEGRVAVMVDGTPFALVVPYLFSENFQTLDDYTHRPYYATFIRILKFLSYFVSVFLPGVYVAIAKFHPSLFPHNLLYNVADAQETTPFSLIWECLLIFFLYEVMREAGLRLPRAVGHAVSIVGALVIGDAAVTAGIIGSPMVIIVALTAISAFVVPSLYESVTILRFLFILLGGIWGLFGIMLGVCVTLLNLCAKTSFGIPITSPVTPFSLKDMRDTLVRASFKTLSKKTIKVQNLPGSNAKER